MPRQPTSIRLSDRTRNQIEELDEPISTVVETAVDRLHRSRLTGDLWVGTGLWKGWRVTNSHAASSHGMPVLVRPDGTALGPGDISD